MTRRPTHPVIGTRVLILFLGLWALPASTVRGHDFGVTPIIITVTDAGLDVRLDLHPTDLLQNVLGDESGRQVFDNTAELTRHADRIRSYVLPRVKLAVDGSPLILVPQPDWPPPGLAMTRVDSTGATVPASLPLTLTGMLPPGAAQLTMSFLLYGEGEFVPLFDIVIKDTAGTARRTEFLRVNQSATVPLAPFREHTAREKSVGRVFGDFLVLGFTHIVPLGLDHILFVLGLFLLGGGFRSLLKQVTAFTVAHSLTLALAMLGILRLPSRVVEPLIALSIAYVAIENLYRRDVNRRRWLVVFGFGLIHGLGFAGVLEELGLPPGRFLPALIGFNLGVEGGQLTVLLLATLGTLPFRHREWYRPWVARPACLVIAGVGFFWAVQRVMG
ncbi:MAG TPA: HupE/UreJ family protein [Candidatus Eisenbacteria bacterium]